jgi:arylformamidase
MNRKIIDISLPISKQLPIWPGDPPLEISTEMSLKNGDSANVSRINMSVHTGTHLDAPLHFFENQASIEEISLELLIGEVSVVHFKDNVQMVTSKDLQSLGIAEWPKRLLMKTRNSSLRLWQDITFHPEFCALSTDAADFLVNHGVLLIGIDYLSIAPYVDPDSVHKILLHAGVIILEGLNLIDVTEGNYELICLPIKIMEVEGAPARAILISN